MNYKKLVVGCAGAGLLIASAVAGAAERSFTVFAGVQAQSYSTEVNGLTFEADRFRGAGFGATGAFNDNWGARFLYYSTSHNDADVDNTGFEGMVLWGTNLRREGFNAFLGAGFFSETLDFGGFDIDASGWLLGAGAGYHWDRWMLELTLSVKDGSDYESFYRDLAGGGNWTVIPSTVGFNLGYRF